MQQQRKQQLIQQKKQQLAKQREINALKTKEPIITTIKAEATTEVTHSSQLSSKKNSLRFTVFFLNKTINYLKFIY